MLLVAVSLEAQSVADVARRERERHARVHPTQVITSTESTKVEPPKAAEASKEPSKDVAKDAAKTPAPAQVDPVQLWNNQLNQLRAKIRALQDQEMALMLQQNQATNQVYAPVTDPVAQQRALDQVGEIKDKLAALRKDLDESKKTLDAMQLQGPPKK